MKTGEPEIKIGVVGPCTAGKSTLIKRLGAEGINARHIAQEHSYVQAMWQRITNPDVLVFLDVSYPVSLLRRRINWTVDEYQEQQRRLQHARAHAHLYLMTDEMSADEVAAAVLLFLGRSDPD
jgi:ATPase subunit of ABC transporter with duplicated ATPase domains